MNSVPSIPGVEAGAPWLDGYEHVLTAGAPGLLATLHRTSGPRRAELLEARAVRDDEPAGRVSMMPRERSATSSPPGSCRPRSR